MKKNWYVWNDKTSEVFGPFSFVLANNKSNELNKATKTKNYYVAKHGSVELTGLYVNGQEKRHV